MDNIELAERILEIKINVKKMSYEEVVNYVLTTTVEARDLVTRIETGPYIKDKPYPPEAVQAQNYLEYLNKFYQHQEKQEGEINLESTLLQKCKGHYLFLTTPKADFKTFTFAKESMFTYRALGLLWGGFTALFATYVGLVQQPEIKLVCGVAAALSVTRIVSAFRKVGLRKFTINQYNQETEENLKMDLITIDELKKVLLEKESDIKNYL